jgi:hypothetical protein
VADDHLIGADGTFSAVFYDQEVTFSTRKVDGMTWLDEPAEGVPFQSPVTYSVRFDGSPGAMVVVHWSRWLEKGTGEHEELQAAITSLIEAGWRPETTSYHFEL